MCVPEWLNIVPDLGQSSALVAHKYVVGSRCDIATQHSTAEREYMLASDYTRWWLDGVAKWNGEHMFGRRCWEDVCLRRVSNVRTYQLSE